MKSIVGKMRPISLTALLLLVLLPTSSAYSQSTAAEPTQSESKPATGQPTDSSQSAPAPSTADTPEPSVPMTPEEMRHAQLAADTKKLLQLAAELRAEVAKTNKETLSLTVVKKAEEVEKLAKSIKERMNSEAKSTKH